MAQTWSSVIIQILIKGNFIKGNPAGVATAYDPSVLLSDSTLTDGGGEFPFGGVVDRILQAMSLIVTAIGSNRQSEYRTAFLEDTAGVASGALIPRVAASSATKYRFGVLSDVKDGSSGLYLTETAREIVLIARKNHTRQIVKPYQYYTDDTRLWHTRSTAKSEIVAWDKAAERAAMIASNHTSVCPLPDDLLPALEFGSLGVMHRNNFNIQQAEAEFAKFVAEINRIAGKQMPDAELAAKV